MIEERYLQKAISIRRTYLKLVNNMDLYKAKVLQVSDRLTGTLKNLEDYQKELDEISKNKKSNLSDVGVFDKLLKIIDEVEEEGKRLEKLIDPINFEIEKLSKEEMELYKQITDTHPKLSEDQIVEVVQDRLIKEGLSQ